MSQAPGKGRCRPEPTEPARIAWDPATIPLHWTLRDGSASAARSLR